MRSFNVNRLLLAVVACVLVIGPRSHAQGFTLQVTERTNDVLNLLNGVTHPGFLLQDPGPGGLPNALTFTTPAGLVAGDLLLQEPGGGLSDLIRWNPNNATLVFYSDIDTNDQPPFDSADIGFPGASYANTLSVFETGLFGSPYSEATNGYVYVPLVGQPGYYPAAGPNNQPTYIIISDIPEPSTLALLILGMGGLLTACLRNRKG